MNKKSYEENNLVVKIRIYNLILYVAVSLFISLLLNTMDESVIVVIVIYLPLIITSIIFIVVSGGAKIDYNGFKVYIIIGKFYIEWKSIEYVKIC